MADMSAASKAWYKELKAADYLLILALMAAIVFSSFSFWKSKGQKTVYVYKNDLLWGEYPLAQDRVVHVDAHNSFEIRDYKVGMIKADCPDKRCIKQGFGNTLPIICLPNKLMIQIKDGEEEAPHILY